MYRPVVTAITVRLVPLLVVAYLFGSMVDPATLPRPVFLPKPPGRCVSTNGCWTENNAGDETDYGPGDVMPEGGMGATSYVGHGIFWVKEDPFWEV